MQITRTKIIFIAIFLICTNLLGYAFYIQKTEQNLPCPLCVIQRIFYWLIGLIALLTIIRNPRKLIFRICAVLMVIFSFSGGVVAIRQSWLAQHSSSLECGMSSEEKFLNALPFAKWWPDMFEANGNCADVTWKLISLTIPDWSILCFTGLCLMAIYTLLSNRNQS